MGQGLLQQAGIAKAMTELGLQSGCACDYVVQCQIDALLNQMAETLPAHLLSMTVPGPPDDGCMADQK